MSGDCTGSESNKGNEKMQRACQTRAFAAMLRNHFGLPDEVTEMTDIENLVNAVERGAIDEVTGILDACPDLVNRRDETGATPLHYAAFGGQRPMVHLLIERGGEINAQDSRFGATPAGWAIEYLRELGAFLGIELADFAFSIRRGDIGWARRLVKRYPGLRTASDTEGIPFKRLADQLGNEEIMRLFD